MIFKKPYAFFIKNFKLFHLIICVLASILLYRTSLIYSFILEYVKTNPNLIGKELTDVLFVNWSYILVALIIAVNILIIVIMIRKQKPYMYYILNIALYISTLIIYIVSHKIVATLEVDLVEAKTMLAIRDILNLLRMGQTISIIFYLVRATGFDIKKFDFVRDLQSLDISEEDSEEYELAVEFEKNIFIRNLNRRIRNAKYYYKENKFIINIIILIILGITLLSIYFSINKYNRTYKENEYINVDGMQIGVTNSYITNKDYKEETITTDDYSLVLVRVSARSNQTKTISTGKLILTVNDKDYYHIKEYSGSIIDIGTSYNDQKITEELAPYIFVYKIPSKDINKKMEIKYIDKINKNKKFNSINIKISPLQLDKEETTKQYNLSQEIDTNNNISTYKININEYTISNTFTTTYNSCYKETECYEYKEILSPTVEREKEKTIMKVNGNITYKEVINNITDIYGFIKLFGSIEYTINGKTYIEKNDFNQLKFNKLQDDNYYIEVNKEIINADKINLVFNIRNNKYVYTLKGDANA